MYIVSYKTHIVDTIVFSETIEDEAFSNRDVSEITYEEIQNELWNYREKVHCVPPNFSKDKFIIVSVTKLKGEPE